MEYLKVNPELLPKLPNINIHFIFDCFHLLKEHIPIEWFNLYLNTITEYRLKNIWNHIILKWIKMQNKLNSKALLDSEYSNQKYNLIHENITYEELNYILNYFIKEDILKALFAANCIQDHFIKI